MENRANPFIIENRLSAVRLRHELMSRQLSTQLQPSSNMAVWAKAASLQSIWLPRRAVILVFGAWSFLLGVGLVLTTLPLRAAVQITLAFDARGGPVKCGHFQRIRDRSCGFALYGLVGRRQRRARHSYCHRGKTSSTTTTVPTMAVQQVATGGAGYVIDPDVGRCEVGPLPPLNNKYFALRHGQSIANMEGIISSDPDVGAVKHGLTSNGRAQARAAATALIEVVGRDRLDSLVFISSGYLRARQTAEECRAALENIISFERQATSSKSKDNDEEGDETHSVEAEDQTEWLERHGGYDVSPPIIIKPELRERSFGELDGTVLVNYNKVWPEDLKDGKQKGYEVESVCEVAARVGGLVRSLEKEYDDACIVFSSHADTLQIAQCYIAGVDERLFSQYRFKNGEVRGLLQDFTSLPPPNPMSFK